MMVQKMVHSEGLASYVATSMSCCKVLRVLRLLVDMETQCSSRRRDFRFTSKCLQVDSEEGRKGELLLAGQDMGLAQASYSFKRLNGGATIVH